MSSFLSFAASIRTTALVIGVSLAAVACSNAATEESGADNAAATAAAPVAPKPISADGTSAARAMLDQAAKLTSEPSGAQGAAFKEFALTSLTGAFMLDRGTAGRTYYFVGDIIVEGDIIDGSLTLMIEESWANPEWGPGYSASLTQGDIPSTARKIEGVDLRPLGAIQGLAAKAIYDAANPNLAEFKKFASWDVSLDAIKIVEVPGGNATYYLEGSLVEGGDMIVGDAKMTINEKHTGSPEYNVTEYTAKTERSTH